MMSSGTYIDTHSTSTVETVSSGQPAESGYHELRTQTEGNSINTILSLADIDRAVHVQTQFERKLIINDQPTSIVDIPLIRQAPMYTVAQNPAEVTMLVENPAEVDMLVDTPLGELQPLNGCTYPYISPGNNPYRLLDAPATTTVIQTTSDDERVTLPIAFSNNIPLKHPTTTFVFESGTSHSHVIYQTVNQTPVDAVSVTRSTDAAPVLKKQSDINSGHVIIKYAQPSEQHKTTVFTPNLKVKTSANSLPSPKPQNTKSTKPSTDKEHQCSTCLRKYKWEKSLKRHMQLHNVGGIFHCKECNKTFNDKSNYNRHHIQVHSDVKRFQCEKCCKRFGTKWHLQQHLLIHIGIRSHQCSECGKKFARKSDVNRHAVSHLVSRHVLPKHKCALCFKEFTYNCNLKQHMKLHSNEKEHKCCICNSRFSRRTHLKRHLLTHEKYKRPCHRLRQANTLGCNPNSYSTETDLPCETKCPDSFDSSMLPRNALKKTRNGQPCQTTPLESFQLLKKLENSIRDKRNTQAYETCHSALAKFECEICLKRFTWHKSLKRHMVAHGNSQAYTCDMCDKTFMYKLTLKRHQILHSNTSPYMCEYCDKRFSSAYQLKEHLVIHQNKRPFQCTTCDKTFRRANDLKRHSVIHEPPKHSCPLCKLSFTSFYNLKQHLVTHVGLKQHKCDTCDSAFIRMTDLKRHQKIHTRVAKPIRCNLCGEEFTDPYLLKKHKLVHSTHQCDICSVKFSRGNNLKRHRKTHFTSGSKQ